MTRLLTIILLAMLFTGCASVKMESKDASDKIKKFAPPGEGNSALYIYRDSTFGGALKKNLLIDGKCVGESAPNVFFYTEVTGGGVHVISTESEFSPNTLALMLDSGKSYFIRQYIKMGIFIGGADLEAMSEDAGKLAISQLQLATGGGCSK